MVKEILISVCTNFVSIIYYLLSTTYLPPAGDDDEDDGGVAEDRDQRDEAVEQRQHYSDPDLDR